MVTTDSIMDSSMTEEDKENHKPKINMKEKLAEKLRNLARPLKLTKPNQAEIVLDDPSSLSEATKKFEKDKQTKWLQEKIQLKNVPIASSKSPKTHRINKKIALKKELEEKMKTRRNEEQEERFIVYNADNEIAQDDEDEEAEWSDEDEVEKKKNKKPKIAVNEDEEIIETKTDASDSDIETDDEDEAISDEEDDLDYDEEDENKAKNPMIDDEASEESDIDEKTPPPSRIVISDDDNFEPSFEVPSLPHSFKMKAAAHEETSQVFFATDLTQLLESEQRAPIEPDPSPYNLILDTQVQNDELVMLCSGSFGTQPATQSSDQTMCSKFEKYNVTDFLSDSTPLDTQELAEKNYLDKNIERDITSTLMNADNNTEEDLNSTQQRINAIYQAFDNAEDSIMEDVCFSDSDSEMPRKRKVVVYSDDEEDIQETKPKIPKIFDSDDSEDESRSNITSSFPTTSKKTTDDVPLDYDDIFTTEDPSNKPGVIEIFESDAEDLVEEVESEADDINGDDNLSEAGAYNKFVDDQASLSGDDIGDDSDNEDLLDGGYNDYEVDEADKEDIDQEEVRNGLVKQYLKQINDDDEKRLYRLQEKFLADGDLHGTGNMDRSFRARMGKDITDEEWQKLVKLNHIPVDGAASDDDEEGINSRKKSLEVKKWLLNKRKDKENVDDLIDDDLFDTPLFAAGRQALSKSSINVTSTKRKVMVSRDSLLHSNSLAILMKENTVETKTATLFTNMKYAS